MRYTTIIFDMDGTIIDTEHIWQRVTRDVIEARGHTLTQPILYEIEHLVHGLSVFKSCAVIKDFFELEEEVDALIQEKSQRAMALYPAGLQFIEGFKAFHKTVQSHQLKHAIATNADDRTIAQTNLTLKLQNYFGEHIYGISHVNHICKPHPAVYLHAARQLKSNPAECIALEDSHNGIKAAKAAGMFCIAINTSGKPEQLREADILIDTYKEINIESLIR